jgi:Cu2+-exporting ATPase
MSETSCFHCGEPVPPGVELSVRIDDRDQPMCCTGCRAVATLIHESGLGRYYDFRDQLPERPEAAEVADYAAWDREAVLDYHASSPKPGVRSIVLVLENVHCAACAWLVNHYLSSFPGVSDSRLDVSDGRLRLTFDPAATPLSQLAAALERLGYPPHLDTPDSSVERDRNERRRMLRYLMVAGLGMMQVMSYALAKYIGAFQGMDPEFEQFFKLISMLVAVPVALYAGQPFYKSALRHLMQRHLGIDVPVAAALLIALFSSVLITLFGEGEVYFDSVVMFLFFLLIGRFAVMVARQRSGAVHSALAQALPDRARRVTDRGTESVGVVELVAGDRVLVGDGEVVPADGRVIEGRGRVDESLLSGESEPRGRVPGDAVLAGSMVVGGSLTIALEAVGRSTVISGIIELLSEARRRRPRLARLADRAAGVFIAVILVSAVVAGTAWALHEPARVIPITLAMLVVACPCALALGTPTALAAATRSLAEQGVLTANPDALEALPDITHVMLDKTGTLTEPRMSIIEVRAADEDRALAMAAALERASAHPIASAFRAHDDGRAVTDSESETGAGVSARIDGQPWWLGRADWVAERSGHEIATPDHGIWIALASSEAGSVATFRIDSRLRRGAAELVAGLKQAGVEVHLASGDRPANVQRIADVLGIEHAEGGMRPEDKLDRMAALQRQGARVAMVGDGINDAPVLAGADIAIALAEGAAIARTQADLVATGRDLRPLLDLFERAPKVRRVIRQNLVWALSYNISALPLAAMGWVPPWAAAIGMSASSLAVVLNAQRLGRRTATPRRPVAPSAPPTLARSA